MPRLQDILFALLGVALVVLVAFHVRIMVLALLGAFACGSAGVLVGMLPSKDESFLQRAFTSGFLATVLSSLVLILPATLGSPPPGWSDTLLAIAALLPLGAILFEIIRTPRVLQSILRCLGYR